MEDNVHDAQGNRAGRCDRLGAEHRPVLRASAGLLRVLSRQPYGQNVNAQPNAQQNLQLLDTNGDGQVTAAGALSSLSVNADLADDAFSPYCAPNAVTRAS